MHDARCAATLSQLAVALPPLCHRDSFEVSPSYQQSPSILSLSRGPKISRVFETLTGITGIGITLLGFHPSSQNSNVTEVS